MAATCCQNVCVRPIWDMSCDLWQTLDRLLLLTADTRRLNRAVMFW